MEGWKEAKISFRGSSRKQAQNVGRQEMGGEGMRTEIFIHSKGEFTSAKGKELWAASQKNPKPPNPYNSSFWYMK